MSLCNMWLPKGIKGLHILAHCFSTPASPTCRLGPKRCIRILHLCQFQLQALDPDTLTIGKTPQFVYQDHFFRSKKKVMLNWNPTNAKKHWHPASVSGFSIHVLVCLQLFVFPSQRPYVARWQQMLPFHTTGTCGTQMPASSPTGISLREKPLGFT